MQRQIFPACAIDQIHGALQVGQAIDFGDHQMAELVAHSRDDGLNISGKTGVINGVHPHRHTAAYGTLGTRKLPIQVLQHLHH